MGYDRGDSFPFDFEPNGNPFGSKSKGKLSPRSYPIQCERKGKYRQAHYLTQRFSFTGRPCVRIRFISDMLIYSVYNCDVMVRGGLGCPQLDTHDCRQTPVSRSAARLSVVGFPVWCSRSVAIQTVTNHTNCMVKRGQMISIDGKKI